MQPADVIKQLAREVGFDDCRIAAAAEAKHAGAFREWIADGCHGDMAWLERTPERRCDPREVLDGCRSVVCLALNYYPGPNPADGYRIAKYAWNDDYHDLIVKMLKRMDEGMAALGGTQRYYVDTGPVLERDHASEAGLGWNGKSTVQIHPKIGTWFFLAELLTTLDLPADPVFGDHCGKCTRCIDACPTKAITAPHRVDARRCISYLTIEHKGPIPEEFREAIGDRLYGCDECLDVCPWNRFAKLSQETSFHAREAVFALKPRDFLALTDDGFRALFSKSPIKRIKRPRFLRNTCVVLGNTGTAEDLPALEAAAADPDPLIAEHARWAVRKISERVDP
ncbi:tRNA epoxyqueuosine(34) reductase QueG [Luteolibacter marinus]|uniref:tRNA epoxyqueuosine(34) reductase QueG n=1 Tax=Luteolibacter marinus TaxID=2776705 RepID=UPI0018667BF7|nr:tRNA epoxyqueuosine(34) reductase QueG [Luteolibacter marinus]